jgi:hypothetical protein
MNDLHKYAFDYRNAVLPDDAHEAWIELEQYVKQLINEEREACANVAAWILKMPENDVSAAIRARGQG